MKWDDIVLKVIESPNAEPSYELREDEHAAIFMYDGDPMTLLMLGMRLGRQLGRRLPMHAITQPG